MLVKAPWKEEFLIECCRRNGGTYAGRSLAGVCVIEFMEVPAEPLPPGPIATWRASTFWQDWLPARFFELGMLMGIISTHTSMCRAGVGRFFTPE